MAREDGLLPLSGIRVVEVGYAMAGPLTARYLGHFGADIIRVESRRKPDSLRVSRSSWLPAGTSSDISQDTFPLLNLSSAEKRSIVLEIDKPAGYQAFSRIVATADVLVTNLSADALPKLRLGYGDIQAIRSDVIYLASTAFGHDGPYQSFRTWGMNLCAVSGLEAMVGWPDRDPTGMGMSFPDYPSALIAVTAIVAALQRRASTGAGAHLELPQFNVGLNCIGTAVVDAALGGTAYQARGNRSVAGAPQGVYPARGEDRWVAVSATDDAGWAGLGTVDGLHGLAADPRFASPPDRLAHHDELDDVLAAWTQQRSDWAAAAELQEAGVAAAPVFDGWDVIGDPHLASRSFYQLARSTRFGQDLVCRPAAVPAEMTQEVRRAVPGMGEHTREILRDLAGLDELAIEQLLADGTACEMAQPQARLARPYLHWVGRLMRLPWPSPAAPGLPSPGAATGAAAPSAEPGRT
jgi:crotonobetainyl-CoA:carnitine CoA-transferase CaiB-like acyl-CoA transferase